MEHLFFDLDDDFKSVVTLVFESLGISDDVEGDSQNVLGGIYGWYSVFGVSIKIELNSYDYEDEYRYMICVKRDPLMKINVDPCVIESVAKIVTRLLAENLGVVIALEKNDELEIYSPEK